VLRLTPDIFWALSLVEWRALLDGRFGRSTPALARNDLQQLMRMYPDGRE
jgi:uncharacterized phage protein (TIGR02216 family)